jgi:threonine dehydratase
MEVDDAYRSLRSGRIETNSSANTIADGLRTTLGDVNFPIIRELVSEIIRVEEEEIVQAMRFVWERLKIIIEPSCAVPFAALVKEKHRFGDRSVGIILSGGNVDLSKLPF